MTRQAFLPLGAAVFARMINNELDVDWTIQPGEFVAGNAQNPAIRSWNAEGPSWGAADACMYTLGLNTRWVPMADVHVRRAVQAAINRQDMVDLAYEGGTIPLVLPFSSFGGLDPYEELVADLVEKYKLDNPSQEVVDAEMKEAGYEKDSEGFWAKDGTRMQPEFPCACWLGPICDPFFETVRTGQADMWIIVHCGSSREL